MAGIDTARMTLAGGEYIGDIRRIPQILDWCEPRSGVRQGVSYSYEIGGLGNLNVRVYGGAVSVEGSLPRWYLGDNLQTLTRGAVRDAVCKLSDTLHLPIELARVGRFDIGANLITKRPPTAYFGMFRDLARCERIGRKHELMFKGGGREFVLYDKIQEVRKHHGEIPGLYQGRNVLRVEGRNLRVNRRTAGRFGVFQVLGRTLYEENFYISAMKDYKATYDNIVKITTGETEKTHMIMKTLTEMDMAGRLLLIHEFGGMEKLAMELDAWQAGGMITRQQKCKLLEGAKKALEYADSITTVNSGVAELDALMKRDLAFFP